MSAIGNSTKTRNSGTTNHIIGADHKELNKVEMNQIAFEIGWHTDQTGGLWNVDVDELNHHLRRSLHTKNGDYRTPLELVHERLQGSR